MTGAELVNALDGRWHRTYGIAICPAHDDRSPSLSISDGADDAILVHCHAGCEQRRVIDALRSLGLWPDKGQEARTLSVAEQQQRRQQRLAKERERRRRAAFIEQTWRQAWKTASPACGSPIEKWLSVRGIALDVAADIAPDITLDPVPLGHLPLRWHPRCPLGNSTAPAVVALMTDALSGEPCGIHRTYLTPDGSAKAFGKDSRKMLGRAGIIRLSPDDEVEQGLGICEGIETGLAIIAFGWRPIWACGSLSALTAFPVLAGIERLTIFSDPKPHEIAGARACADRWAQAGRETIVRIPGNGDWNDALVDA